MSRVELRNPKVGCTTCFLNSTRYQCKLCNEPTCFNCWIEEIHICQIDEVTIDIEVDSDL